MKAKWGYILRAESFYNVATKEEEYGKAPVFIVTHSPILLGIPDAEIFSFDKGKVHPCSYEETDSYIITSMFLKNREQILKKLLNE